MTTPLNGARVAHLLLLGLCIQLAFFGILDLGHSMRFPEERLLPVSLLANVSLLWTLHRDCRVLPSWQSLVASLLTMFVLATVWVSTCCCCCRCGGQLTACKSNLKNIGTACEMYSSDYAGRYPPSTRLLTPNYLKTIPTCAAAGRDTYSRKFSSSANPDAYTFMCSGYHHKSANEPRDYPQYNSTQGLTT